MSIAINRDAEPTAGSGSGVGVVAVGGIAPVAVDAATAATVPVQRYASSSAAQSQSYQYTLPVDAVSFPGLPTDLATNTTAVLDLGGAFIRAPAALAAAHAAAFMPPAVLQPVLDDGTALYVVDCATAAPDFRITVGGAAFVVAATDQVVRLPAAGTDALCVSAMQPGAPGDVLVLCVPFDL